MDSLIAQDKDGGSMKLDVTPGGGGTNGTVEGSTPGGRLYISNNFKVLYDHIRYGINER